MLGREKAEGKDAEQACVDGQVQLPGGRIKRARKALRFLAVEDLLGRLLHGIRCLLVPCGQSLFPKTFGKISGSNQTAINRGQL